MKNIKILVWYKEDGKYYTEERLMLCSGLYTALNDFVIKGCNQSRSSKFYLEINDNVVCNYIADGIIISTPIFRCDTFLVLIYYFCIL